VAELKSKVIILEDNLDHAELEDAYFSLQGYNLDSSLFCKM
jgi:hypothetical protein